MTTQTEPTPAPQPTDADQSMLLLFSIPEVVKQMMKTVQGLDLKLMTFPTMKAVTKDVNTANRVLYTALSRFRQLYLQTKPSAEQRAIVEELETIFLKCAHLPIVALHRGTLNSLHDYVDNFHSDNFAIVDQGLSEVAKNLPDTTTDAVLMLLNQYYPGDETYRKKTLAKLIEQAIYLKQNIQSSNPTPQ